MQKATVEDYLKTMYILYEQQKDKQEGIKSVEIAKIMKIKKPSVSAIVRKLEKQGFIQTKPYAPVFFTTKGLKEAIRITHNHRLIEYFLREILKGDLKNIHREAHRLEHAFSEATIRRLDEFLGNPKTSPYGKRIHSFNEGRQ